MRLLQILLAQSEGGAETFFEKMAIALNQDPLIEQKLIIEAHSKRKKRLDSAGCRVVELSVDWLSKKLAYNIILKWKARQFRPDITLAWMSRSARKTPRVKNAIKVARIGGYYPVKHYKSCDYLVVNTPELFTYMVNQGWDSSRIAMISNFGEIPLDTVHGTDPRELVPEGQTILFTLGRLHQNKAQDVLIKALPLIPNAHLCIAGEGKLESELKELAKAQGVSNRVHFLGWRRDTKFLFDSSDICVFPSRQEPLGNVIIESWATRKPVVAAKSAGPRWLIDDNENGLLCPVDDHLALASQVNRLINDREIARRLVENGYKKFKSNFTKEVIISQYQTFFAELLNARKTNRSVDLSAWHIS